MIENCPMRHENGNCIPAGGFCTANKNICEALRNAYRMGKAQLSKEGTTSDLISKTEVVKHLRRMLESTVPNTDYDEGFIDGVEFGVSTVSTMPTTQPERAEGEWIVHLYKLGVSRYECDACHARCDIIYPYCPYCGEKKEGERDATN